MTEDSSSAESESPTGQGYSSNVRQTRKDKKEDEEAPPWQNADGSINYDMFAEWLLSGGDLKDPNSLKALPLQSDARPLELEIFKEVEAAGSDDDSFIFQEVVLPAVLEYRENMLHDSQQATLYSTPEDFVLKHPHEVRVYFVGEGAGYHNSIGINTGSAALEKGEPALIFPNASSAQSWVNTRDTRNDYTNQDVPLLAGDFVNLGEMDANTLLDFFLISDGARGGEQVLGLNPENNPGNMDHVTIHGVINDSMILVGFEDQIGGGDQDYEDAVIAVDIGPANVKELLKQNPNLAR